jgi:hypothetical protein
MFKISISTPTMSRLSKNTSLQNYSGGCAGLFPMQGPGGAPEARIFFQVLPIFRASGYLSLPTG